VVALTVVGTAGLVLSASWVDDAIGLGPVNVVLAVVLVPLLVLALGPGAAGVVRLLWPAVAGVGLGIYLPALWQTPQGMYDALHGARSIDEVLGPVAGNFPLADYVPQYGGMLGLPLVPFRSLVAPEVETTVMAYLSVLSIATIVTACVAAALVLPPGRRALAPLLVVPVLLMKPSSPDKLVPDGVERLFQSVPERSLLPLLLGVLLLLAARRPASWGRWTGAGVVAGVAALNNFESGVTAALAALAATVALRRGWRPVAGVGAGMVAAVLGYLTLLAVTGRAFRPEYLVAFGEEFAGGFAQLPMPPYGNHVFILFVLVASAASAFPVLWHRTEQLSVAAVGGLFFGLWGLAMFPYYVGRSSSMGQLQFFLIPASIAAVWLLVAAAVAVRGHRPSARLAFGAVLCCLPAAVFATAVLKAPSPDMSYKRLTGGFAPGGVFRSTAWKVRPVVDEVRARQITAVAARQRQPVGLFFTSGSIAALRTGLPNASLLAVPEELMPQRPWSLDPNDKGNATFRRLQCQSLAASRFTTVLAEDGVAAGLDPCAAFTRGQSTDGMVVFTRRPG